MLQERPVDFSFNPRACSCSFSIARHVQFVWLDYVRAKLHITLITYSFCLKYYFFFLSFIFYIYKYSIDSINIPAYIYMYMYDHHTMMCSCQQFDDSFINMNENRNWMTSLRASQKLIYIYVCVFIVLKTGFSEFELGQHEASR